MDIVRFITAGSVDDGKSTLIGRLLYDTQSIYEDQLDAISRATKTTGGVDLSLLTDGLRSEREQGITIDVAYRYFQTAKRKFIMVDAPGHAQYTRNMTTGASNCDLALILIDARNGILTQTLRHSFIVSLLGIKHVFICVNKMDLMNRSQSVFEKIVEDYKVKEGILGIKDMRFFPISALTGENIVERSQEMAWYKGQTLLEALEAVEVMKTTGENNARLFVQHVLRDSRNDYRAYAGMVDSGEFRKGDKIHIFPSQLDATIESIDVISDGQTRSIDTAKHLQSVAIRLAEDVDISRGELMVNQNGAMPFFDKEITAMICWMDTKDAKEGNKYILQIGTNRVRVSLRNILHKVNIETYMNIAGDTELRPNEIAKVILYAASPVAFEPYSENTVASRGILLDETTNITVAACMFC